MLIYLLRYYLLFFGCLFFSLKAHTQNPISISPQNPVISLGNNVAIYFDATAQLTLEEVTKPSFAAQFKPSNLPILYFNARNAALWIRFELVNTTNSPCLLEFDNPNLDNIQFYYLNQFNQYTVSRQGMSLPLSTKLFQSNHYLFPIPNLDTLPKIYYIRVFNDLALEIPLRVGTYQVIMDKLQWDNLNLAIYFGILLAMIAYHLFWFIFSKDKSYLYYVCFLLSLMIYMVYVKGFFYFYLPQLKDFIAFLGTLIIIYTAFIFSNLFSLHFLEIKKHLPLLGKALQIANYLYLAAIVPLLVGVIMPLPFLNLSRLIHVSNLLAIMFSAGFVFYRGYHPAGYFLLAWFFLAASAIWVLLVFLGWLPYFEFTDYLLSWGSILQVIAFSLALGSRINLLRKEKKQVEQENLRLIAQQKEDLEQKVQAKTEELYGKLEEIIAQNEKLYQQRHIIQEQKEQIELQNQQLHKTNRNLKTNEGILIKAYQSLKEKKEIIGRQRNELEEKNNEIEAQNEELRQQKEEIEALNENLESLVVARTEELAQTVENLSHQIQNLEQFSHIVSHNMRAPVARIIGLLNLFDRNAMDTPFNQQLLKHIEDTSRNLDTVIYDLTEIISVRSRLDKVKEPVNLRQITNVVIDFLRDEVVKNDVVFEIDFADSDSLITMRSYLQSILFNLIGNAIKYRAPDRTPHIKIRGRVAHNYYRIKIADNGMGIDLDKKDMQQIFGLYKRMHLHVEGKGLGLYLVKTQVESLHGKIEVCSKVDVGTEFTLLLPLTQSWESQATASDS
jgi:signal transduction histidine kinase